VQGSGLEQSLIELVKIRASQINGCAFCINMQPRTRASTAKPNNACTC
jgi:alkylhydroperoxidase family enzyme